MAEIVRFSAGLLVARQVERLGRDAQLLYASVAAVARRGRRGARPELEHPVLVIRAYGPLGCHGAGITPKQRFLDSIRGERVAENLLNTHVHCAFALSCRAANEGPRNPDRSGMQRVRCNNLRRAECIAGAMPMA